MTVQIRADSFGDWTYTVTNGVATITEYSGDGGAVIVPSEVNGIPVRQVGNGWPPVFGSGNTNVTSVTLPEGVTHLGSSALYACINLTSLTLPSSLTALS